MKLENPLEEPGVIVLDTEPTDPTKRFPYKAIIVRKHANNEKPWERGFDGAWILKIVGIYTDGPSLTPGQWYLDTLLGYDDYGSKIGDFIYIDAAQHWGVGNMLAVLKEAEEIAYGKMDESLHGGALLLKGFGPFLGGISKNSSLATSRYARKNEIYEPFLAWIYKNSPLTISALERYARKNEMTLSELRDLATLYMEDATDKEIKILDNLVMTIEGKIDESLNEGAVRDLILRGPGREPMIIWASKNAPFSIEELQEYAAENELSIRELKTIIEIYMEDATDEEMEILSDMEIVILETEREGGLNEAFEDKYAHIPMNLRNWYQRPEVQAEYEEEKKVRSPKKRKPTKKVIEQIENLEGKIQDLRGYLRILQNDNANRHSESEEYSVEIINTYGEDILDLLNSGASDDEKIRLMKEWNLNQDEKDKEIGDPKSLVQEHSYYYGEEKDKEEGELEKQIGEKEKELDKLTGLYESLNEGISHRINFKRFEEEILKPLAEDLGVDFKVGRVSRVQSIGKKIIERYYAIGSLSILVRDIKRLGMPGEDIEPWIVDPNKPTKGLRFGSDWGSYKEFKNRVKELLSPKDDFSLKQDRGLETD